MIPAHTLMLSALCLLSAGAPQDASPLHAPPVVRPAGPCINAAPADAIVIFDGTSLEKLTTQDQKPCGWTLNDDKTMTVKPGTGFAVSKETFQDAQIHVEFATPKEVKGEGQDRGNSGVYLQGRYEVQVLDSFESATYPDGQCGAVYKQYVPLVNACLPPGEWQSYDIVFHAARFDQSGKKIQGARLTVLHNGILIQDNVETTGTTGYSPVKEGPEAGSLFLQDHGCLVKYRNIWIRKLGVSR